MIRFDPARHDYGLYSQTAQEWQPVPSVTQVLADMGFVDTTWFTDYGRERGKLIHRIIHWYVTDDLDPDTVDASLQGYLDAWKTFVFDTGFVSTETEKPLASEIHRFAGTPDHVGYFKARDGMGSVIDVKSGAVAPWTGIQLAGYQILYGKPLKRFALALKEDGKYSLKEFKDRQDRQIFLAALACWQWQHNNGGK